MTLTELYTLLDSITELKNKVRYRAFAPGSLPTPPYAVYLITESANFTADNKAYFPMDNIDIEIYTASKDISLESKIEAALDTAEIPWRRSDTYDSFDEIYETIYSITIRR